MRTRGRMLAAATLAALTVLPAGVAQASQAEERSQRVLERTLAREHHAVPAAANPATPAAQLRTQAREQGAYPIPTGRQTTNTQGQVGESWRHPGNVPVSPAEPSRQPDWLVPGIGVLAAVLALVAGLVVLATRRAKRRVRASQAA
jgi:hypothetical protein